MASYKRAKVALNAFRNLSSKLASKTLFRESSSKIYPDVPAHTAKFSSGFYSYSCISRRLGFSAGFRKSCCNPSFNTAKRYYYVDRYQVQHFRPRGPRRWLENPRNMLIVVFVGSGVLITLYFGNLETIPYTKRTHFVLLSKAVEKQLGEAQFEQMKAAFKGKILPAIHPDSIRVRLIAKDIIEALQRGLKHETVWSDLGYASSEIDVAHEGRAHDTLMALSEGGEGKIEGKWHKDDELLDDKWVQQSRKKGQEKGLQSATSHLDGLNWEVLVVNEPVVNAFCLPGGKIVVFTGLLEHFRTDAEIATIIGHEVSIYNASIVV